MAIGGTRHASHNNSRPHMRMANMDENSPLRMPELEIFTVRSPINGATAVGSGVQNGSAIVQAGKLGVKTRTCSLSKIIDGVEQTTLQPSERISKLDIFNLPAQVPRAVDSEKPLRVKAPAFPAKIIPFIDLTVAEENLPEVSSSQMAMLDFSFNTAN